jgi:hypothetical protein
VAARSVEQKPTKPSPPDTRDRELALWNAVKDSTDAAMFREYLKEFPDGTFAGVARLKIEKLGKRQATFTAPPKPVTRPSAKPAVGVYPKAFKPGEVFRDCEGCRGEPIGAVHDGVSGK